MTIRAFLSVIFILLLSCQARAFDPEQTRVQSFLSSHCLRCHGLKSQKADRRFDQLEFSNIRLTDAGLLQDIVDQLNLGTMPPEGEAQPDADEIKQAVSFSGWKIKRRVSFSGLKMKHLFEDDLENQTAVSFSDCRMKQLFEDESSKMNACLRMTMTQFSRYVLNIVAHSATLAHQKCILNTKSSNSGYADS